MKIKIKNDYYIVFKKIPNKLDEIEELNEEIMKENNFQYLNIIFDFDDLSQKIRKNEEEKIIDIIDVFKEDHLNNINIFFKNCLFEEPSNINDEGSMLYTNNQDLLINKLYISDELYTMSPYLNLFFKSYKPKKLILKKIKINSKLQLQNFFNFISKYNECSDIILEDVFIELIIKNGEDSNNYNELNQYFYYSKGNIYIKNILGNITNIKKLKLIDCPLFYITEEIFNDINKNIYIDVDYNSILNPNIVTKFKIKDGLVDVCFDLDSYKIIIDENKDYLDYLKYIFDLIIKNDINYRKIKFKNFDMTKLEYIIENNYNISDEDKIILNEEERKRKDNYEKFEKDIKEKLKNIELKNIKELIFDNCTNYFVELILSITKTDLDLLKIKKCAKDKFNLNNILSLNISHLILFDTPITISKEQSFFQFKFNNLTLKINSLEYYCSENNINYNQTLEFFIELISNSIISQNIFFEMNTLPVIMKYLISKKIKNLAFKSFNERIAQIKKNKILYIKGLDNKNINIKNNSIYNCLNIYEYNKIKESDLFDFDIDYAWFFNVNKIKNVILEKNIFENVSEENNKNIHSNLSNQTLLNILHLQNINYKIDFTTIENSLLNKNYNSFSHLFIQYINCYNIKDKTQITKAEYNNIKSYLKYSESICKFISHFINNNLKITFIINNRKEQKELYILLHIYLLLSNSNNNVEKIFRIINKEIKKEIKLDFYYNEEIINKLDKNFMKRKNENNMEIYNMINYYYLSDDEIKLFEDFYINKGKNKIIFDNFIFNVEYNNNIEDFWNILYN